jgi:acetyl-CoA C-acetyltransferase
MVETLRNSQRDWGMVTANGGFLSEHSVGLYSTVPFRGQWCRSDPAACQQKLNKAMLMDGFTFTNTPKGDAILDTCVLQGIV